MFSQVNIQWEARFNNNTVNGIDQAKAIAIDNSGSVFTAGSSYNGSDFDGVLVKYNTVGTQLWSHVYSITPFAGFDEIIDLKLDAANNAFICGITQINAIDYDIFVRKIDGTSGLTLWTYILPGTPNYDQCKEMKIDNADNVVVTGAKALTNINYNFTTFKLDGVLGNLIWQTDFAASGNLRDVAKSLVIDTNNDIFVVGESRDATNGLDFYVIKYSSSGALIWETRIDGYTFDDSPEKIFLDNLGNVIVTGQGFNNIIEEEDVLTVKLSPTGAFLWKRNFSGTNEDFDIGKDLKVDALNNIYVVGRTRGSGTAEDFTMLRYRPNGDLHWNYRFPSTGALYEEGNAVTVNSNYEIFAGGFAFTPASNNDYLTLKLDTLGILQWSTKFNGSANNSDQSIQSVFDNQGNVYVTGTSKGSGTNKDFSTIKYCQYATQAGLDVSICAGEQVTLNGNGISSLLWGNVSGNTISSAGFSCVSCDTPTLLPTQTSIYTLSSVNALGCLDLDTVRITVNSLPTSAFTFSGPTAFCKGDSVVITSSLAATYNWSTTETSQSITVDSSASISITITDFNGCAGTSLVAIVENPYPEVLLGANDTLCAGESKQLLPSGAIQYQWQTGPGIGNVNNQIQNIVSNVTYTYIVTGINSFGCADNDSIEITILPNPVVTATADFSACPNVPIVFNANGAGNYIWNSSPNLPNPISQFQNTTLTASETFIVRGIAFNGCFDIDTVNVNIYVDPNPLSITNNAITFILTSNLTSGIEWFANGAATGIITPTFNYNLAPYNGSGTFYSSHFDVNGCRSNSNEIVIDPVLINGLNDEEFELLTIFPNPTNGMLNFAVANENVENFVFNFYDVQGKEIKTYQVGNTFDLTDFNAGVYTIKFQNSKLNIQGFRKIIKL